MKDESRRVYLVQGYMPDLGMWADEPDRFAHESGARLSLARYRETAPEYQWRVVLRETTETVVEANHDAR